MKLYKKLAYVGSVWGLLAYTLLILSSIVSFFLLEKIRPLLETQELVAIIIYSIFNIAFLLGIVGIATCIITIISVKKIKKPDSIRKKLSVILIAAGIILVILLSVQSLFLLELLDIVMEIPGYYPIPDEADLDYTQFILSLLFNIIPSILLIVSGILSWRFNKNQKINNF